MIILCGSGVVGDGHLLRGMCKELVQEEEVGGREAGGGGEGGGGKGDGGGETGEREWEAGGGQGV